MRQTTRGQSEEGRGGAVERRTLAEERLVRRVHARCDGFIQEACRKTTICPAFLGALTANESGGNPSAVRFEPAVYRHLKAVAAGESPRYGSIGAEALYEELGEVLHPKASEFHKQFLDSAFTSSQSKELSRLADEALRELACSWGFVQIMGFHVVGRPATVRDLLKPQFHYQLAIQLLSDFARTHRLDLNRNFEELFRCWNTGRPNGKTMDTAYVANGLRRMAIYRECMFRNAAARPLPPEGNLAAPIAGANLRPSAAQGTFAEGTV